MHVSRPPNTVPNPVFIAIHDLERRDRALVPVLNLAQDSIYNLVHQVRDWFSGAAAYFGWMREAKRENTRCGLRPMSDKAASQKTRSPEGCDENGPAAALLLSH